MITIEDKTKCCGCHACMNVCPKQAITMEEDEKGFKYPTIDKEKCINCGLCEKVCPIINKKINNYNKKVYAVINKNEKERLNSSSGGIFVLLAKEILKRNGIVFGAAFDDDFNVNHIYIDNINDIEKLQGSKYLQSNINYTYKTVKEFLDKDKYVLFTGTSCQIDGLKTYLMKDYDKLYTQDIICHGVPSSKVWQKYLEYQKEKYNENVNNVYFRNKTESWQNFKMKILFDTKTYSSSLSDDLYMRAFLKNSCLRDSCYKCSFKNNYRNSDITLADYWGIKNFHPSMDDNKGTSCVIINSKKGQELFDKIKENCIYEESKIEYIYKYNSAYIKSAIQNKKTDDFFENLDNCKFDKLIKKNVPKTPFYKKIKRKVKLVVKKIIKK